MTSFSHYLSRFKRLENWRILGTQVPIPPTFPAIGDVKPYGLGLSSAARIVVRPFKVS